MNDNEGDRISELPESVLHHILSFLDLKLAIQTSILSTKWRYVWKSLPYLKFEEGEFYSSETERAVGFDDFVDNVLNLRDSSSSIQRFLLSCDEGIDQSDFDKRLSKWILTAVESNVQDLFIYVYDKFQLPQCLFTCKYLRKLYFEFLGDDPDYYELITLPDSMNLPGLKTLVLGWVEYEGNDDIHKIISSCPVLESLELEHCKFHQPTLDIYAPQLKHLVFRHYSETDLNRYIAKLNAPNLVSFCCDDNIFKDYCLVNSSALVKAEIIIKAPFIDDQITEAFVKWIFKILRALHNVETLTLSVWFIEVVSGALVRSPSIQFCNLRCLKLEICHSRDCFSAMAHLLKISPNIESLDVDIRKASSKIRLIRSSIEKEMLDLAKIEDDWEVATLHHLKFVKFYGVRGYLNELQFLEFLLKNSVVLEKVIVDSPFGKGLSGYCSQATFFAKSLIQY